VLCTPTAALDVCLSISQHTSDPTVHSTAMTCHELVSAAPPSSAYGRSWMQHGSAARMPTVAAYVLAPS